MLLGQRETCQDFLRLTEYMKCSHEGTLDSMMQGTKVQKAVENYFGAQ